MLFNDVGHKVSQYPRSKDVHPTVDEGTYERLWFLNIVGGFLCRLIHNQTTVAHGFAVGCLKSRR